MIAWSSSAASLALTAFMGRRNSTEQWNRLSTHARGDAGQWRMSGAGAGEDSSQGLSGPECVTKKQGLDSTLGPESLAGDDGD